jgi:hypothetical protein
MAAKTALVSETASRTYAVGERVDKFCASCGEERGHIIASVTKRGKITRVVCPKCQTRGAFKASAPSEKRRQETTGAPYDRNRNYRTGQTMMHPIFGLGEVTAVIEPQKIDVLFADRVRRLIHGGRE